MKEYVVGYKVLVYNSKDYEQNAHILEEHSYFENPSDSQGYRLGNALKKAEQAAQRLEKEFEGKYVEVDCIWRELKQETY